MARIRVFSFLACVAAGAALMPAMPALADSEQGGDQQGDNFRCSNQTLGSVVIEGNLIVPHGTFCDLNGTHVTGNATVESGRPDPANNPTSLTLTGATVDGNVRIQQNAQFAAFAASTVGGSVSCNHCEVADVQDSTVKGNHEVNGVSEGAFIRNSSFGGTLSIHDGTDFFHTGFHIDGNRIGENLVFNRNTTTVVSDIVGNTIAESLICNGNSPPPVGGGNIAKDKRGQCKTL